MFFGCIRKCTQRSLLDSQVITMTTEEPIQRRVFPNTATMSHEDKVIVMSLTPCRFLVGLSPESPVLQRHVVELSFQLTDPHVTRYCDQYTLSHELHHVRHFATMLTEEP